MPLRSRLSLLIAIVVIPLALLLLGMWEMQRGADHALDVGSERAALKRTIQAMEALPPPANGGFNMDLQYRRNGQLYGGDMAISEARGELGELDIAVAVANYRQILPPILIGLGGALLAIGLLVLGGATILGALGSRSRRALAAGFALVRRLLPVLLPLHIIVFAGAVVVAVLFEFSIFARIGSFSQGQVYLLGIALVMIGASLITAFQALTQLRRISHLFEPDKYELIAHGVSREQAPGLWALVDDFSRRLGIAGPDTIATGLVQGFFVMSGAIRLLPSNEDLVGNTLHVPLGHLALMQPDEVATIIGHELAHFAGQDTVYSEEFLPIYAGVGRSLDAIAGVGRARDGSLSPLAQPALMLGGFVMDRFHLAVRHWSRRRELEADATSATLTSMDAAGRALVRHEAISGLVTDIVNYAWANPDQVPDDLIGMVIEQGPIRGLDDPSHRLADTMAHPTDSHPANSERLAAFGFDLNSSRIASAMELPTPETSRVLARYFNQPSEITRQVTAGLLEAARTSITGYREQLTAVASEVSNDVVELYENSGPIAVLMFVIGVPLLAVAAWTSIMGLPGFGAESMILVIAFGCVGVFICFLGFNTLWKARVPFLRLYPDRVEHRHLDRPILWSDVRGMSVADHAGTMVTAFLLKRQAVFPQRRGGGARVRISPGDWTVTLRSVPPRHYKSRGYIELMHRYADAATARDALAQTMAS